MKYFIFFIFLLSLSVMAQEYTVPMGTEGNRLILTVKNGSNQDLQDVSVIMKSSPNWIVFDCSDVDMGSISINEKREAEFTFSVLNGEEDQIGVVQFVIENGTGSYLIDKTVSLRSNKDIVETVLFPVYPNPTNPEALIRYNLDQMGHVQLEVYNILGQCVRSLLDEEQSAGRWEIMWDGKNDQSMQLSSGMYLVKLRTTVRGQVKHFTSKILLQK